jgi:hypothetical protein
MPGMGAFYPLPDQPMTQSSRGPDYLNKEGNAKPGVNLGRKATGLALKVSLRQFWELKGEDRRAATFQYI